MSNQSCLNCRFWVVPPNSRSQYIDGQCRRHAPIAFMKEGVEAWPVWPTTSGLIWCGDWEQYVAG